MKSVKATQEYCYGDVKSSDDLTSLHLSRVYAMEKHLLIFTTTGLSLQLSDDAALGFCYIIICYILIVTSKNIMVLESLVIYSHLI